MEVEPVIAVPPYQIEAIPPSGLSRYCRDKETKKATKYPDDSEKNQENLNQLDIVA